VQDLRYNLQLVLDDLACESRADVQGVAEGGERAGQGESGKDGGGVQSRCGRVVSFCADYNSLACELKQVCVLACVRASVRACDVRVDAFAHQSQDGSSKACNDKCACKDILVLDPTLMSGYVGA
jgi:hypothetical protein